MINSILAVLAVIIVLLGGLIWYQDGSIGRLEVDNHNKDQAIKAYEDILIVVPFSAMTKERKDNAKEEISKTLDNSSGVNDGSYNGV